MIGDIYTSPWGRWFVLHPGVLQSLERSSAYVLGELGSAFTPTGERHEDHRDEACDAVVPVLPARSREAPHDADEVADLPVVVPRGVPAASTWLDDLPPIPAPAPLTLGAQRPGSVRSDELQWLPCMTFLAFDEGEVRYLGAHCHFIAPLDGYPLRCEECLAARAAKAPVRRVVREPTWPRGPVAIVMGVPLTLSELLADVAGRVGLRPMETPAPQVEPYPYKINNAAEWREEFTERAAIFEYLGGHPRPVAETMARELIGACP